MVLVSNRNRGEDTHAEICAGSGQPRRTYVQRITDDGSAWGPPVEITKEVHRGGGSLNPGWRWSAAGPAAAVALTEGPHAGRLVVACNHTVPPIASGHTGAEDRYSGNHLIYSDGGGRPGTWRIGAVSAQYDGVVNENETALTVLADGRTLHVNARVGPGGTAPGFRADGHSTDGGLTYASGIRPQVSIVTTECQGSLLTLPDGRLVYAGPSAQPVDPLLFESLRAAGITARFRSSRAAMALRVSDDEGRTWQHARTVTGLPAAYSSMALLDDDTIGLLYETGDGHPYQRIELERVPVAALG